MSLDVVCPECGAEYDARIGRCPVCHPEEEIDEDI